MTTLTDAQKVIAAEAAKIKAEQDALLGGREGQLERKLTEAHLTIKYLQAELDKARAELARLRGKPDTASIAAATLRKMGGAR